MAASLQPRMFAKGAMESIGVDNGDWVPATSAATTRFTERT